ncbi:MAG TPA: hypothetical protein VED41_01225 [Solirubrobacteraceae bacterium]|nr:hypothetical protein [Solirubrobacteraceae bacterium]
MRIGTVMGVSVAAVALAAMAASSAYAVPPINLRAGLELTERGTPVAPGGQLVSENFIVNGECVEASYAKLLNNGDPADVIQVEPPVDVACQHGSISGGLSYVALSDTGQALVVAPSLELTQPGPCVYDLTLLTGQFNVGPEAAAYVTGEATGVRNPWASRGSCARSIRTGFSVGEYGRDEEFLTPSLIEGHGF